MSCNYRPSKLDKPTLLGHCASHDKKKDPTKLHCGSCEGDDHPTSLVRDLSWDNIVHDLQNFSLTQHDHHVFINTLPEKYEVCNITRFDGKSIPTVNDVADVSTGRPSCYLYCAHEKCSSAEKYAERYWDHLSDRCSSISYIKPGAREMLNDEKFSLRDKSACRSVLQ